MADKRIGNKFALGLTTSGRPPIYSDDEKGLKELTEKCVEYFANAKENSEKATITGLALYLGFSARKTLYEYADKKVFGNLIKRAMLAVENSYETNGTAFDIFALKNMGWKDKTEVENTNTNIEIPLTNWVDSTDGGSDDMDKFGEDEE